MGTADRLPLPRPRRGLRAVARTVTRWDPTLSAQTYAEVAARLHQRAPSPSTLALHLEELDEFRVVPLDRDVAKLYASIYRLCLANTRSRGLAEPEIWFAWQIALHRAHGCRILTNDRARYAGIVPADALV